jgi:hypothetical protein
MDGEDNNTENGNCRSTVKNYIPGNNTILEIRGRSFEIGTDCHPEECYIETLIFVDGRIVDKLTMQRSYEDLISVQNKEHTVAFDIRRDAQKRLVDQHNEVVASIQSGEIFKKKTRSKLDVAALVNQFDWGVEGQYATPADNLADWGKIAMEDLGKNTSWYQERGGDSDKGTGYFILTKMIGDKFVSEFRDKYGERELLEKKVQYSQNVKDKFQGVINYDLGEFHKQSVLEFQFSYVASGMKALEEEVEKEYFIDESAQVPDFEGDNIATDYFSEFENQDTVIAVERKVEQIDCDNGPQDEDKTEPPTQYFL